MKSQKGYYVLLAVIVVLVLFLAIHLSTFTGFVVKTDALEKTYTSDTVFLWQPEQQGTLNGLGVTGTIVGPGVGAGHVRAYIYHDNQQYLIYETSVSAGQTQTFANACTSTCSLYGFDAQKYIIRYEVSPGVQLVVHELIYGESLGEAAASFEIVKNVERNVTISTTGVGNLEVNASVYCGEEALLFTSGDLYACDEDTTLVFEEYGVKEITFAGVGSSVMLTEPVDVSRVNVVFTGTESLEEVEGKYVLTLEDTEGKVIIDNVQGLANDMTLGGKFVASSFSTPIIALDTHLIGDTNITLQKSSVVNSIVKCDDFDIVSELCNSTWEVTALDFEDRGTEIFFQTSGFSAYAGSDEENEEITFGAASDSLISIGLDRVYPTVDVNVTENQLFNVTVNVSCSGDDCGEINSTLARKGSVFVESLGGANDDFGYSVVETSGGGFVVAGSTKSYGGSDYDVLLVKFDGDGVEQWTKSLGGSGNDNGYSVVESSDGGFVVTGSTLSYGGGGLDVLLVKFNGSGVEQWTKSFGGGENDYGRSVIETSDGGFVVTGAVRSYKEENDDDVLLVKFNGSGVEQWTKSFGGGENDYGRSVIETSDGGLVVTGYTQSYGAGSADVLLVKFNGSGVEQWTKSLGGANTEIGELVVETSDGGFVVTGYTQSYGAGSADVLLVKFNGSGVEQWTKTFGELGNDYGRSVIETSDGGFVVTGTKYTGVVDYESILVKFNGSGVEQWTKYLGGSSTDDGYSVIESSDGGFVVTGLTKSYGGSDYDVLLAKFDSEGNIGSFGDLSSETVTEADETTSESNEVVSESDESVSESDESVSESDESASEEVEYFANAGSYSPVSSSGSPFRTTTSNPYSVNLNQGESELVTWLVNATGDVNSTHSLFVYANKTSNMSVSNETSEWNSTIVAYVFSDTVAPVVSLVGPNNGSTTNVANITFNATFTDDVSLSNSTFYLWNASDGVLLNQTTTIVSGLENSTNLSTVLPYEGTFLWNYQANDSSGNSAFNGTNYTITYSNPFLLDSCGIISDSGVYNLTQDVSSVGTCFNITGNDVVLDGKGFLINYSQSEEGYGMYAETSNITIKNFIIKQGNSTTSTHGIYLTSVSSAGHNITNNTIETYRSTSFGIILDTTIHNSSITGNVVSVYGTGAAGLRVRGTGHSVEDNEVYVYRDTLDSIQVFNAYNLSIGNNILNGSFYIANSVEDVAITNNTFNLSGDAYAIDLEATGIKRGINFSSNYLRDIEGFGLRMETGINGSLFSDQYITDYSFGGGDILTAFENTSFGKIEFIDVVSGSGTDLIGSSTSDIRIQNNSVFVDSDSNQGVNSSANVTLFGMSSHSFTNPVILRDGVECNNTTSPSCTNFTSLHANVVKFNVSSWSNYSIGELSVDPYLVNSCRNLTSPGVYNLTGDVSAPGTCFNVTSDDVVLDGKSNTIAGSGSDYSIFVWANNVTLKDLYVDNRQHGIQINFSENITLERVETVDSTIGISVKESRLINLTNVTAYNNTNGISFDEVNDSTIVEGEASLQDTYGYYVLDSDNLSFTLVAANNNTLEGMYFSSSSGSSVFNATAANNTDGVRLSNADNNELYLLASDGNANNIHLTGTSANNLFHNVNLTKSTIKDITDSSSNKNYLFYNNSYGSVKWIGAFADDLDVDGNLTFPGSISIGENDIKIEVFSVGNSNGDVNLTLRQLSGLTNPSIYKDGSACGSCEAFTALTDSTVEFNSTGTGNFTIESVSEGISTGALPLFDAYPLTKYPSYANTIIESTTIGDNITLRNDTVDALNVSYFLNVEIANEETLGEVEANYTLNVNLFTFDNLSQRDSFPAADIVWIIDKSGSIRDDAAHIRSQISTFTDQLSEWAIPYRLGLVEYEKTSTRLVPLGNITNFQEGIDGITFNGGIENGLTALDDSLNYFSFNDAAEKVFILVTDEDSDDCGTLGVIDDASCNKLAESIYNMNQSDITVFGVVQDPDSHPDRHRVTEYKGPLSITNKTEGTTRDIGGSFGDILQGLGLETRSLFDVNITSYNVSLSRNFTESDINLSDQTLSEAAVANLAVPSDYATNSLIVSNYEVWLTSVRKADGTDVSPLLSVGFEKDGQQIYGYENGVDSARIRLNFSFDPNNYTSKHHVYLNTTFNLTNASHVSSQTVREIIEAFNDTRYSTIPNSVYQNDTLSIVDYSLLATNDVSINYTFTNGTDVFNASIPSAIADSYIQLQLDPQDTAYIRSNNGTDFHLLLTIEDASNELFAVYNTTDMISASPGEIFLLDQYWNGYDTTELSSGTYYACATPQNAERVSYGKTCYAFDIRNTTQVVTCGVGPESVGPGQQIQAYLEPVGSFSFTQPNVSITAPFSNDTYQMTDESGTFVANATYWQTGLYNYTVDYLSSGIPATCSGTFTYSLDLDINFKTNKTTYTAGEIVILNESDVENPLSGCYEGCAVVGWSS